MEESYEPNISLDDNNKAKYLLMNNNKTKNQCHSCGKNETKTCRRGPEGK